jgi:hypothetical protein
MTERPAPSSRRVARGVAAAVLLTAAGCGGSSSSPSTSATASPLTVGTAKLIPMPAGTATLSRHANSGLITIAFDVYGMTLRSIHAVVLRSGSCRSTGGHTVADFPDLTANAYGAMKGNLTSIHGVPSLRAGSQFDIELAPAAQASSAPGSTDIACADITAADPSTPLTLTPFPDQKPSPFGTVTLTYFSSGRLVVHVVASGLAPSTRHASHVHFGSCQQQSGVLYTLGDVSADAHGNVDSTITLKGITTPPPPQGWYADLHLAPVSGLEAGGQPTLLFQALLCGDGNR